MGIDIPYISDKMIADVERIFAHGPRRAKSHDLRFGQWICNKIYEKYPGADQAGVCRMLFNLENQELWDLMKGYND